MEDLSLDTFSASAAEFLRAWPLKPEREATFAWGRGSDAVAIFEELDAAEERIRLDEVRRWRRTLWEAGYGWLGGPTAYGGRALPAAYQATFDALARQHDVPGNAPLTVSLGMVAPTVLAHGLDAAKQRYLPAMYRGDVVACQLFSEPGAGSDLAGVTTRARRDGDGWRVTGQKVWTSGAHLADIGEVLCRTSDGPRHQNLTMFVVDMRSPGVEVRPLRQMTGGSSFNEVFLQDVWIPDTDRLGDVDGGWRVAMTTLANERSAIGGSGFGGKGLLSIERLAALVAHAGRSDDPVIRQQVGTLVCGLRTASWTRRRLAAEGRTAALGPILKLALCRDLKVLGGIVEGCLGPSLTADTGEWGTYAWANFVVGLPGYRIGGGTDEVLKSVIAERALGLPKERPAT